MAVTNETMSGFWQYTEYLPVFFVVNDGMFVNVAGVMPKSVFSMLLWSSCANLYTSVHGLHVFQLDGTEVLHS